MSETNLNILQEIFLLPLAVLVLTLLALGVFSAWVDYQVRKGASHDRDF